MDLYNLLQWVSFTMLIVLFYSEFSKKPLLKMSGKQLKIGWFIAYTLMAVEACIWYWG